MDVVRTRLRPLLRPWLTLLRVRSEHTARSYEWCVTRFLDELGDESEITPEVVAGYMESLDGLASASVAHHVSAVRSFLKFAQRQGVIERSPVDLLVRPRVQVVSFSRYLELEEMRALVAAARELGPRHYACVMLLLGTGIRVGEASKAVWRDLFRDPGGRLGLRVVFAKGGKQRVVKLRADVFDALAELHGGGQLDARDATPLLPTLAGSAYTTRGLFWLFESAVKRAGLSKSASPHWARHSHASHSAYGGASAFEIREALGHARLETSQSYVTWARGLERTTVDSLPQLT